MCLTHRRRNLRLKALCRCVDVQDIAQCLKVDVPVFLRAFLTTTTLALLLVRPINVTQSFLHSTTSFLITLQCFAVHDQQSLDRFPPNSFLQLLTQTTLTSTATCPSNSTETASSCGAWCGRAGSWESMIKLEKEDPVVRFDQV